MRLELPWTPPGWAADTSVYLAFTAALALIVHQSSHSLTFVGAPVFSRWIPVAFIAQSAVVALLALRIEPAGRWRTFLLDLAAWAPPLVLIFSARLGIVPDATLWIGVSLFCKAGAVVSALRSAVRDGLPDGLAAVALGVFLFALYAVAIPSTRLYVLDGRGVGLTGDEPIYIVASASLVGDHDLFLEDEYAQQVYWTFYPGELGLGHSVPARDGHIASFHDSGLSILAAVPYAIGGWHLVLIAIAAVTATLLSEVYRTARTIGLAAQPALLAAALAGLTLPLAAYSTQVYPEVPIGLATIVATRQLWARQRGRRASPLVAGLAIATLPWLHVRSWPLVIVLSFTAVMLWRRWPARAAVLIPGLAGAAGYAALNTYVYGHLILSPAVGGSLLEAVRSVPSPEVIIGQARQWLDGNDGLLLLSPVFALALAALPAMAKMGWAGAGTVAAIVLYSALIGVWELVSSAGWSPPGRFMVPVMPLLAVALAIGLQACWRRSVGMLLIGPLAAWGLVCSFFTFVDRIGVYTLDSLKGAVAMTSELTGVPLSTSMPNFDHPGMRSFLVVAVAVAALAGLALLMLRSSRLPRSAAIWTAPLSRDRRSLLRIHEDGERC